MIIQRGNELVEVPDDYLPTPPPIPEPPVKKYINRDNLLLAIRDQLGEDRADAIASAILSKPFLALRFSSTDIVEDDPDFLSFLNAGVANNLFTQDELIQILAALGLTQEKIDEILANSIIN